MLHIKKILKEIFKILLILLVITFISFSLMYIAPSDPAEMKLTSGGGIINSELLQETRIEMGLDKPFIIQYINWLSNVLKGDLGVSYSTGKGVLTEIVHHLPYTLTLAISALVITLILSIPLGVLCAVKKDTLIDKIIKSLTFIGNSMPSFFIALILLLVFALKLKLLPILSESGIKSLILPSVTLAISMSSKYIRQIRTIVIEELEKDYVIGAISRGMKEKDILFIEVLKNTMVNIVTLVGLSFGSLMGGTAVIESIFVLPGLGTMALSAISNRDYSIIQGYVLFMAIIFVTINYITNILYKKIDPRIGR